MICSFTNSFVKICELNRRGIKHVVCEWGSTAEKIFVVFDLNHKNLM